MTAKTTTSICGVEDPVERIIISDASKTGVDHSTEDTQDDLQRTRLFKLERTGNSANLNDLELFKAFQGYRGTSLELHTTSDA